MNTSRKGQGISINMVIIAAIALLVLVISVILVSKGGKSIDQNAGTQSCIANGGVCKTTCDSSEQNLNEPTVRYTCPSDQSSCCRYDFSG